MRIIYSREPFPSETKSSIFLAGPTPRTEEVRSWRPDAIEYLISLGYDGDVYVPENRSGPFVGAYRDEQISWEEDGLNRADCILFWVPREMEHMPALTTNDEWGVWKDSGKVVFGAPPDAPHIAYQRYYAKQLGAPQFDTLSGTVQGAVTMVTPGSARQGGETCVPLNIWKVPSFQSWYQNQKAAGNRLDGARSKFVFCVGPQRNVFLWVLDVNVFVAAEGRNKNNELVVGRPDVSTVILWKRSDTPMVEDAEVVLVKEFRSPVRTPDAFIREFPSGSSWASKPPLQVALDELREEAGISISPNRLRTHSFRQIAGTFSPFGAHVFSAEITQEELDEIRTKVGEVHGLQDGGERTYIEVSRVSKLIAEPCTDWATLGMVFAALSDVWQ